MLIFTPAKSSENTIKIRVNNEIITNFDLNKEEKYLIALSPELDNLEKKQLESLAKNSIINEKIKKIELEKFFELNKNIDKIKNSKIFLTQLEIPKDVTLYSLKIAKENKVLTILNPAPASKISKEFFNYIDYFTPNETEAEFYTGIKITNEKEAKEASIKLLNIGLKRVIITLGEKGLFYSDGKEEIYLKATQVKAIDTTGAGDAFNGGLAYALSQNKSIKDSLNLANQVAGLSTLKLGAGNAMPLLSDLG